MEDIRPSPPLSIAIEEDTEVPHGPYHPHRPTLPDVLSNSAPPPWTLSAFTAYLSQNHCLENLEFTLDAERYKKEYDAVVTRHGGRPVGPEMDGCKKLRLLWNRLLDAYITPNCPREINIPSHDRDTLLSLSNNPVPPNPSALNDAVRIIYNLMEESVLISFLNEVPPSSKAMKAKQNRSFNISEAARRKRGGSDSSNEHKLSRSKSKRRASPSSNSDHHHSHSDPTSRLTPSFSHPKNRRAPSHTSGGSVEPESLTDDSGSGRHSPGHEPMTPPNTPPSSDFGGSSPKARPDNSWKQLLGWKKKSGGGSSRFDD